MAGAIANAVVKGVAGSRTVVEVTTARCCLCEKTHQFTLDFEKFERWQSGEHIQNVFPEMSAADREILISGTCSECFDELFPSYEEDEFDEDDGA